MSTAPSPRRLNDENSAPTPHFSSHRDALVPLSAPSPSPRPRQPLAPFEHPPNLFASARTSSSYPATQAHPQQRSNSACGPPPPPDRERDQQRSEQQQRERDQRDRAGSAAPLAADATPVRPMATKVDPDARELPLPKGLAFAPPPPPAAALLPLPTPPPHTRTAVSHVHPSPLHHHGSGGGGMHSHMQHLGGGGGGGDGNGGGSGGTPRGMMMAHSPMRHLSTPSARSIAGMSYSSPSTMSHMPSTPDIHASPYPPGPIDLHDLLAPARFPGPLPHAYLNQGEMPGSTVGDDNGVAGDDMAMSTPSTRRTLVSCNPWDYRPEDHGKNKPRRRFSPGELDMLEILWGISHNPHKWQRQKLARWFGCTTRHLTVWFQNRRQDLKKAETLVQMAENNPDTASRALAAVQRANRGDQTKYSPDQAQVIMDIVSDRLLPEMWFCQQPSGSSPTPGQKGRTPSPPTAGHPLPDHHRRVTVPFTPAPLAIAPKPSYPLLPPHHHSHSAGPAGGGHLFALKPIRRGFSLDDVCTDREQSMTHRPMARSRPHVENFEQMHKNDPRYREALLNMLPSELSSDAIEPPEDVDDDDSVVGEDSPTRKRARYAERASRPTLPPIGLGRPTHHQQQQQHHHHHHQQQQQHGAPAHHHHHHHPHHNHQQPSVGHRPRSSFGRASSSDVLACSSRARYLSHNGLGPAQQASIFPPGRAVTDPVPSRSVSAGPGPMLPRAPEHSSRSVSTASSTNGNGERKRKLSRQGSWSHLPTLKHRDSFDRSRSMEPPIEERSSPVPGQTRSPTPTDADSISPKTAPGSEDAGSAKSAGGNDKLRLPLPEGRSIYSFSTELEPEIKRGTQEMDENVLTGAHALMELFRGR